MAGFNHPILEQSFAVIDREIGPHSFTPSEYAILRRVIHSTADFEFKSLIEFSPDAIQRGIRAIQKRSPIVTDVSMVSQGIRTMVAKTFQNPVITAVERAAVASPGQTRTETGLLEVWNETPDAIFVIGNAPTALLALCDRIQHSTLHPALVIGAPVGFISVVESKAALAKTQVPYIRIKGRKGGSPVAAAILNALMILAWESAEQTEES